MAEYYDGLKGYSEEDQRDIKSTAWVIASPMHHVRGTGMCTASPGTVPCDDCVHAARLVIQHYKPVLRDRIVERMVRAVSPGAYVGPWPRGSDD